MNNSAGRKLEASPRITLTEVSSQRSVSTSRYGALGSHALGMDAANPSMPLLQQAVPAAAAASDAPINRAQRLAVSVFSCLHIVRGLSFMVYPALGLSSFDIPQSGATFLLGSLLGGRDVLLGGLLFGADPAGRREVRRALLVNLLADAMDTCILVFSAACSWHWRNPLVEIASVAVMALLEHLTLWSMSDEEEDGTRAYQALLRANEDKKMRLDNWMADMRRAEENRAGSPAPRE